MKGIELNLQLRRFLKRLFVRFRLFWIMGPFENALLNLVYLSRVSRWMVANKALKFNDFYSGSFNYEKRFGLYEYVFNTFQLSSQILYLEFGVMGGSSFSWWVEHNKHSQSRFFGFDTFEGLPEDWGVFKKGSMSTQSKLPPIEDDRVGFIKGLFQDTLGEFLKKQSMVGQKVIHMDADLYTSTLFVLTSLAPFLEKGDIILFDEYTVPMHEYLAFENFKQSYYQDFELIGAMNNYFFSAFRKR